MLMAGDIQSAAAMPPCPNFEEIIAWAIEHPEIDLGLHLALTSEWKTWRWPSVAPAEEVPGLIDDEGMLWRSVEEVVAHASAEEVATEVRAQIENPLPWVTVLIISIPIWVPYMATQSMPSFTLKWPWNTVFLPMPLTFQTLRWWRFLDREVTPSPMKW